MRPVKTRPRFRCDFCWFTATEPTVAKHERICWRNPGRYCDTCNNTGEITTDHGPGLIEREPCYYCREFDPIIAAHTNGATP